MTRLVVAGTDTDVGKTVFAAGLVQALNATYWKPVQAGLDDGTDTLTVQDLARQGNDRIIPEVYRLGSPLSPHRAAEIDNVLIDTDRLTLPEVDGPLVIEGAGGLLVPLTREVLYADLIARWSLPVVLVGRTALGAINHALLSIEAMRSRGIRIIGIAFVGDEITDTQRTIAQMGKIRQLGRLPILDPLNAASLQAAFDEAFNLDDFQL
ncbi:dethiobiotin synthase [Hoeflea prorocentri]|uniref:ATP-dependent dethiobiotin synthetase BioD n=1 Tax=Hoeflea prorocentri TaxID=1922333 RepID=A0A9X3UP35_9HYPH|nr:dethiobiotin synthase [Hoeflea prorocentri]MCY6382611.1 dethiobiotin synthase [Hoeflea prorocentri]MDA5400411.1 dethiobiotin synthase [Hoeflea prorocentri]